MGHGCSVCGDIGDWRDPEDRLRECACGRTVCGSCATYCEGCGEIICQECGYNCHDCEIPLCDGCIVRCEECGESLCGECEPKKNGKTLCKDCV